MKKDQKIVVNGYSIPGGLGRIAVAAAVELVRRNPGVRQTEVLKHAVEFSGLNESTASWITSPGKGPCGALWERRGSPYQCYLIPAAEGFNLDPIDLSISHAKLMFDEERNKCGMSMQPGDIVHATDRVRHVGHRDGPFLFLNYVITGFGRHPAHARPGFTDPSALEDRSLWGHGMPTFAAVGIYEGKQTTIGLPWLRAKPLGT